MDTAQFMRRKIDFYLKGLSFDIRNTMFKKLDKINPISVEHLLEKPIGYPYFKRLKYTEEEIQRYLLDIKAHFDEANAFMIAQGRRPLFSNTDDSYLSAVEFTEIMQRRPLHNLEEEFGCSFQNYIPPQYQSIPNENDLPKPKNT